MGKKQKKAQGSDRISQGDWVGHFAGMHQETGTTFGPPNFPVNTVMNWTQKSLLKRYTWP